MLQTLPAPELFFGLCSPVGTNNKKVVEILKSALLSMSYQPEEFKVTDLMKQLIVPNHTLMDKPFNDRYDTYIKYANAIRQITDDPSALAVLCLAAVKNYRKNLTSNGRGYIHSKAYIFEQFKRPDEIKLLRQVYGRLFILIGIHSDKETRLRRLTDSISEDTGAGRPSTKDQLDAKNLMNRDEKETNIKYGQKLSETFAMSDLFIDIDNTEEASLILGRFLKGFFGSNEISPTRAEYGMYLAKMASLRSTDLSRQVGAAVCTKEGAIITLGSNEVPKSGGGTYWCDDPLDARDYILGRDENERIKRSLLVDVLKRLKSGGFMKEPFDENDIVQFVLDQTTIDESNLKDSQIMDLLEFGRIIHAEMSAICDAARLGKSLKAQYLYCTTFPCHICAKHIIASGIEHVFYVEPYEKSYAEQLHNDSIEIGRKVKSDKVIFEPFIGISPYRYREIFERGRRKTDDGVFLRWIDGEPKPNVKFTIATYLENERAAIGAMTLILRKRVEDRAISLYSDNIFTN